jgi:prophage regulatory protein
MLHSPNLPHPGDEDLRLLRIERVLDLIPVSRNTLYRMVKEGEFPAPYKFRGNSCWSNEELRDWLIANYPNGFVFRRKAKPGKLHRREIDDLA